MSDFQRQGPMLIPIGHDSGNVRRNPWVTYAIMIACLGGFLYTHSTHRDIERRYAEQLKDSVEYFVEHPQLTPPAELQPFLGSDWEKQRALLVEARRAAGALVLPGFILEEQQTELDVRVAAAVAIRQTHPFFRWGLVASAPSVTGAFGYMFIHGGWMHLLGNMLLLFLTGPFIEDKWGRPVYLAFYLLAGLAGAGLFMSRFPEVTTPLVGASGAVAGCMGAFLVRFWNAKLRYLCWFIFFGFTFTAPAWLMMPLWFAGEFMAAQVSESVNPMGGAGVAYWAHVGGFAFGALTAVTLGVLKLEERWMDSVVDRKIGSVSNDGVEAAMVALEEGDTESAFAQLQREVRRDPKNREAAQAFWDAAVALGRAAEAAPGFLRLIREEVREGASELAVQHWAEFRQRGEDLSVDPALALRLGPELAEAGHPALCADVLRLCLTSPDLTPTVALGVARKVRELDPALCIEAARIALGGAPDEDAEARRMLEELGDAVPAPPANPGVSSDPPGLDLADDDLADVDLGDLDLDDIDLDGVDLDGPQMQALPPAGGDTTSLPPPVPEIAASSATSDPAAGSEPGMLEPNALAREAEPVTESGLDDWGNVSIDSNLDPDPEPPGLAPAAAALETPPLAEALRTLKVMQAVPMRLREDAVSLDVDGRGKTRLRFERIDAVAAAAVRVEDRERPVLFVDLALNFSEGGDRPLQVVRLRSDRFDPRKLVPGATAPLDALRLFVERILEAANAAARPDRDAALGRPRFAVYEDIAAYEADLWCADSAEPQPSR